MRSRFSKESLARPLREMDVHVLRRGRVVLAVTTKHPEAPAAIVSRAVLIEPVRNEANPTSRVVPSCAIAAPRQITDTETARSIAILRFMFVGHRLREHWGRDITNMPSIPI